MLRGLDDVRAYGHKAERAAALIYAHFKGVFLSSVTTRVTSLQPCRLRAQRRTGHRSNGRVASAG